MPICKEKDPLIDLLKKYEYCPVALPRTDLEPLQVIEVTKNGKYEQTTHVSSFFEETKKHKQPKISDDIPLPDKLQGKLTTKVKASNAIELMKNWITAMKGIVFNIEKEYEKADKILFEFSKPRLNKIDKTKLDKFINKATLVASENYQQKLKDGNFYIITEILKSNSFSVQTIDKNSNSFSANIEEKNIGKVSRKKTKSRNGTELITYKGKKRLIFAIKAVRIKYKKDAGFYIIDTDRRIMLGDEKIYTEELLIKDNFINI